MSTSQTGHLLPELSVRSLPKIQHGAEKEDADGEQKTWSQYVAVKACFQQHLGMPPPLSVAFALSG